MSSRLSVGEVRVSCLKVHVLIDDLKSERDVSIDPIALSWQSILNTIPVAAYTCDPVGRITYFNALAEKVWGRAPKLRDANERYCGSHQLYLSDGTRISHQQCWMALALIEGKAYHGHEIVIERIDGGRTSGMAFSHPIRDIEGEVIGAVTLVAEVSVPAHLNRESKTDTYPFNAAVAMTEVAISVIAGFPWERSAFQ